MADSPNILVRVRYYDKDSPKRDFYSSKNSGEDYLDYMDNGQKAGKYSDYMDYQGNREKSLGVFDESGLMTKEEKARFRKELRETDSVIWDIIISTEEEFGKERLPSWKAAKEVLVHELPKFIKDNRMCYEAVHWCSALHENTDNRHLHLLMFEKEMSLFDPDTKKKRWHQGMLSKLSIEDFKVRLEQRLLGHEHSFYRHRDRLLELEEEKLSSMDDETLYSRELKSMLLEIYRELPSGHCHYENHEMDEVRPLLDQMTTYMLTEDETSMREFTSLLRKAKKNDEEIKEICRRNKIEDEPYLLTDKLVKDFYRRCGNKILSYAYKAKTRQADFYRGGENQKERWNEKARRGWLFSKAIRLDQEVNKERMSLFDEYERRLAKAEYERLIEEGVIERR